MSLEKVSCILKDAEANGYGVAAFNVFNYETIAWVIQAADEEKKPVIVQLYPGFSEHIPLSVVANIVKDLAGKVRVPVGLHLDHSNRFETVLAGIAAGFPSVMFDGSKLDFEDNIEQTRKVVELAHAMGVEVEAELGHVGVGSKEEDIRDADKFTDPKKAQLFVEQTGVDTLAVAIGNAHGHYISSPELDFERLEKTKKLVGIPLVLHGGSEIPREQLQKAVSLGMSKINIATEFNRAFYLSVNKSLSNNSTKGYMYRTLVQASDQVKEFLKEKMRMLYAGRVSD